MSSFSLHCLSEDFLRDELKLSNSNYFYTYLERYRKERSKLDNKGDNPWKIFAIIEEEYIDKYYLKDYSKYYAECFTIEDKFTKRIHFFQ